MENTTNNFIFSPSSVQTLPMSAASSAGSRTTTTFSLTNYGITNLVLPLSNIVENYDTYQKIIVDWGKGEEVQVINKELSNNNTLTEKVLSNIFVTSSSTNPYTFNVSLSLYKLPFEGDFLYSYDIIDIDLNVYQALYTNNFDIKLLKNYNYYNSTSKDNNLALFIEQQNTNGVSIVYDSANKNLTSFLLQKVSAARVVWKSTSFRTPTPTPTIGGYYTPTPTPTIGFYHEFKLSACDCNGQVTLERSNNGRGPAMVSVRALTSNYNYLASDGVTYAPITSYLDNFITEYNSICNWWVNETGDKDKYIPLYVLDTEITEPKYFIVQATNVFNAFVPPTSTYAYVLLSPYTACDVNTEPCFPTYGYTPTPTPTPTSHDYTPTPTLTPTNTPTPSPSDLGVTPTLASLLNVSVTGNEFLTSSCFQLSYVGPITYSITTNGVSYTVTDSIVQYTSIDIATDQMTYIPSLNGWYMQALSNSGQINMAYNSGAGLGYDVTASWQILTGGGDTEVELGCNITPTVTPTVTPTIPDTATPTVTPTITPQPSWSNTPTPTQTQPTPTVTPTNTPTPTQTQPTPTVTPTNSPSLTPTFTPTPSPTKPMPSAFGAFLTENADVLDAFDWNAEFPAGVNGVSAINADYLAPNSANFGSATINTNTWWYGISEADLSGVSFRPYWEDIINVAGYAQEPYSFTVVNSNPLDFRSFNLSAGGALISAIPIGEGNVTLITPQHGISAWHNSPDIGSTIFFYSNLGYAVSAIVDDKTQIGIDVTVVKLDRAITDSDYKKYKIGVFNVGVGEEVDNQSFPYPLYINCGKSMILESTGDYSYDSDYGLAMFMPMTTSTGTVNGSPASIKYTRFTPDNTGIPNLNGSFICGLSTFNITLGTSLPTDKYIPAVWGEETIHGLKSGDSGGPIFAIKGGEFVLLGALYSSASSEALGYYLTEITTAMTAMGNPGGYSYTTVDLYQ